MRSRGIANYSAVDEQHFVTCRTCRSGHSLALHDAFALSLSLSLSLALSITGAVSLAPPRAVLAEPRCAIVCGFDGRGNVRAADGHTRQTAPRLLH